MSDADPMEPSLRQVLRIPDLLQISGWHHRFAWRPFTRGVEIHRLYGDGREGPAAAVLKFSPGGRVPLHEHQGYEHILVLSGSQVDENSRAETGSLIINPPGTSHSILSENGCLVLAIYEKPVRFLEQSPFDQQAPSTGPGSGSTADRVLLAVNGTLMRGLELNPNLLAVRAEFVREAMTTAEYRLWSIRDRHPAMVRVTSGGVPVPVEVWSVPAAGMATVLLQEPPGLSIGKVRLQDGSEVLGVLGEPALCEGCREITEFGGWRAYVATLGNR
ncbi:MAG: cupin domain-containing protein [Verrucomicrobiales bacterium]|nr:cupin domain-containing protein [Verrucomicrobiales bacterium]